MNNRVPENSEASLPQRKQRRNDRTRPAVQEVHSVNAAPQLRDEKVGMVLYHHPAGSFLVTPDDGSPFLRHYLTIDDKRIVVNVRGCIEDIDTGRSTPIIGNAEVRDTELDDVPMQIDITIPEDQELNPETELTLTMTAPDDGDIMRSAMQVAPDVGVFVLLTELDEVAARRRHGILLAA